MLKILRNIITYLFIILSIGACKKENSVQKEQADSFIKFFGGKDTDFATSIDLNGEGYALTGTIYSNDSSSQAFVIATDKFGNELPWSPVKFGGILSDIGNKLISLKSGGFIVIGTQYTSTNTANLLVARISADGLILWKKAIGASSMNEGLFGLETSTGDILIGGYNTSESDNQKDISLFKLNLNGDIIWSASPALGTVLANEWGVDIVEKNNYFYLLGTSVDIGSQKSNIIIFRVNNAGKWDNFELYGSDTTNLAGLDIKKMGDNFLILGKSYQSNNNRYGAFVVKINDDFNPLWSRLYPYNGTKLPVEMTISPNGFRIYGNQITDHSNIFIDSYDENGNFSDSVCLKNSGNQLVNSVILANDGKICLVGSNKAQNKTQIAFLKGSY